MKKVYIVGGYRTPIGKFLGVLSNLNAIDLSAIVIREIINKLHIDPSLIDEVIIGNVLQGGLGQNVARQIAINAGIPYHVPSFTVNKVCGSGLKSVVLGAQSIMVGENNIVIAGGTESMSNAPFVLHGVRQGVKMGNLELVDIMIHDGLWDKFYKCHMGVTAENIAKKYSISRDEQDFFAYNSQMKTKKAMEEGKFRDEIVPISIKEKKEEKIVDFDEYPRPTTTLEDLKKLKPAFQSDGTVTAGNASGINDGAAAVLLVSEELIEKVDTKFKFEIISFASSGLDPAYMGLGPVEAIKKLLNKTNYKIDDIDLWEINEAFAVQSIQVIRELNLPLDKVNVNGGAIALGHPIGASGTRILITLLHEMHKKNLKLGIASLCIGGGQGIAMLVKNISY
jgi:acetyl-CoA C-acetyltransferase